MGGLAAAAALRRAGIGVNVYEQATKFTRLGAGIQIGCNAMKVMRGLGLEPMMRASAFYPRSWNNREYDTGEVRFDMIFGESAEQRYGAPYLLGHRGDLHSALASAVPDELIHLDHRVVGIEQRHDRGVKLTFANGNSIEADAVVAADGVHSFVKEQLFGKDEPNFTGRIAYRTVFPAALLNGFQIDDCRIAARSISSPASRSRDLRWSPGRRWETSTNCVGPSTASIRKSATCWPPARRFTNGRWSTAIPNNIGATATSPCWATPAIR
jgi:6-hydroxynicotinate 3-monooxygenase